MSKSFEFEALERRDLLATDLLSGLSEFGGTLSSRPQNLIRNGGKIYFDALVDDGTSSRKIFVTTGTTASTQAIFDGQLEDTRIVNDSLFFLSNGSLHVARDDGTVSTLITRELGFGKSQSGRLVDISDRNFLWFEPENDDPSAPPAWLVKTGCDVNGLCEVIEPFEFPFDVESTYLGSNNVRAWFQQGEFIWSTDGTDRKPHGSSMELLDGRSFVAGGQQAIYTAVKQTEASQSSSFEIWTLSTVDPDDTNVSLEKLLEAEHLGEYVFSNFRIVYSARHPTLGQELVAKSLLFDEERTFDFAPGEASSNPENLTRAFNGVLFSAAGSLYYLDTGQIREPVKLFEFSGPAKLDGPEQFTGWNGRMYFVADNGDGAEIWSTDGTTEGTQQVVDLAPGPQSSFPQNLTPAGDSLFFSARTSEVGFELWEMSASGDVRLVKDIRTESFRLPPSISELTTFRGETYFRFNDTDHGVELWKTDGTQAGTQLVKDIYPGPQGGSPRDLVVLGDELYFTANDGRHGYELWRTDGTSAGTRMVADIWPGPEHSNPSGLSVVNDELVFGASDGVAGSGEIWKLDGTEIVVLRELDEEASLLLVPTAGVMHAGDSLFVVSSSGVVGQLFGDSISVRDRSPMYALAEPVTNDGTFFVAALFRGRAGIYRIADRLFSTLALFDSNEETPTLPMLTKFDGNVYFVDDDGTGVGRYLESTRSELTELPEKPLGIASTTKHLFSVNDSSGRFTVSAMDKLGEVKMLVERTNGKPVRLFDDDLGITLVVQGSNGIEVWYSDGTRLGSRIVEELDAETEVREATRSGDKLVVLQARPDGTETLLSLSLELIGDVTQDGRLDATDIDAMYAAIASNGTDSRFDLNQDSMVDQADVELLVTRDLATNFGDLDLDGRVSFADFLTLSQNFGKQAANYSEGDVDGNGEVGFSDFLLLSESFGK